MPASQAFVLMNLDLVAVTIPTHLGGLITVYCGVKRANKLLATGAGHYGAQKAASQSSGGEDRHLNLAHSAQRVGSPVDRR